MYGDRPGLLDAHLQRRRIRVSRPSFGEYSISITHPGFEALKVNGITVSAGAVYNLPLKLSVAKVTSTVEVSAAALSLETTTVAQTNAVPNVTVQSLPVNGRNFTQLVALAPGFAGYGGSGSFNGSRSGGVNQQIEGIDNNDAANNSSAANQGGIQSIPGVLMPLDAIEEFSVQSQGGAEVGRNSGAVVNLIIKSGTNQFTALPTITIATRRSQRIRRLQPPELRN